jgi:hypothetical protein
LWTVPFATATTAVSCKTYLVLDLLHLQLEKKTVLKKLDKHKQQKVVFFRVFKKFYEFFTVKNGKIISQKCTIWGTHFLMIIPAVFFC